VLNATLANSDGNVPVERYLKASSAKTQDIPIPSAIVHIKTFLS